MLLVQKAGAFGEHGNLLFPGREFKKPGIKFFPEQLHVRSYFIGLGFHPGVALPDRFKNFLVDLFHGSQGGFILGCIGLDLFVHFPEPGNGLVQFFDRCPEGCQIGFCCVDF